MFHNQQKMSGLMSFLAAFSIKELSNTIAVLKCKFQVTSRGSHTSAAVSTARHFLFLRSYVHDACYLYATEVGKIARRLSQLSHCQQKLTPHLDPKG